MTYLTGRETLLQVDRAKMAETQTRVDAHIAGGGALW
jgi:hypothetical protein